MICVRLNGGLGNQMFQYALGRALSIKHKTELIFDCSQLGKKIKGLTARNFDLKVFNIQASEATKSDLAKLRPFIYRLINVLAIKIGFKGIATSKFFIEQKFSYNEQIEKTADDCYLVGYWQSPLYFKEIQNLILQEFEFPPLTGENSVTGHKISNGNSISLHIRRGDFLNLSAHSTHGICSLNYYEAAISHITEKTNDPIFFIFSDDVAWAKENLKIKGKCYYIAGNSGDKSYIDMQLMSLCKHNIIANSSFSWWGAWLNLNGGKIVIAPEKWFVNKTLNEQTKDLIPETWMRL